MGQGGVRAWTAGRAEVPEGAEETVVLEKLEKVIPEVPSQRGGVGRSRPGSSHALSRVSLVGRGVVGRVNKRQ